MFKNSPFKTAPFKISSETELLNCFRDLDRDEVLLTQELSFPIIVTDYLTWLEPSGVRAYLVFKDRSEGAPLGISFRRDQGPGVSPAMCEWCHSVRSGESIGLLSATASSKRRVGIQLCRDLSCKAKVLAEAPGVSDLSSTVSAEAKLAGVVGRMTDFARRQLF
ncbi:MAG: FBP domain-containing protein [Methylotenera sp.]|nr:FBP domain-containing protein [Oligoflexia bacterium]